MPTTSLFWVTVAHTVAQIGFFSSSILGFILIFLNIYGVKQVFGTYKLLMNTFTSLGLIFATTEVVLYPNMHSYNAGYFFFSLTRPFNSSKTIGNVFLAGYTGIYASTISLLAVQFIYRYWAVFDTRKIKKFFQDFKIFIWWLYCLFFGLQWALGAYFFVELDEVSTDYFQDEILKNYGESVNEISARALVAYDPVTGEVRWWNLMCTLNMTMVMNIQYGIIIYCGWQMHAKMEEKIVHFSPSLRKHHKQFFKTLVLQITGPTILLFTPVVFIIYLPLLDLNISLPTGAILCGFTLYPAMDAIIVMYVVTEYRNTVKRYQMYINALHINSLRVSAVLSVFVNLLLINVMLSQKMVKMSNYRYLLIFFAIYNLAYTLGDLIIPMCIHDYKYAFSVFIAGGFFDKRSELGSIMLAIRYSFVPAAYGVLTSHFIYRYLAIFSTNTLNYFLPWGMLLTISYCGFLMSIWFTSAYSLMHADEEKRDYMVPSYFSNFKNNLTEMNVLISVYSDVSKEASISNAWTQLTIGTIISCGSLLSYFICGYLIIHKLRKGVEHMSPNLKKLQTQLMKALITQAAVPMAVAFTPCFLAWYLPAFNIPIRQWVFCTSSVAMTFFPVLDPLALFYFVPQFQTHVKNMFKTALSLKTSSKVDLISSDMPTAFPDKQKVFADCHSKI